jgi:AAA+ ATPase superfamily predicted ATPase
VLRSDAARYAKPEDLFDREAEWNALVDFACDPQPGVALGVVSGRLRQGKTYLLEALTRATGGFYFGAQEAAEAESLHRLSDQLSRYTGSQVPGRRRRWEEVMDILLGLGKRGPVSVIIDEFPELVRQSPALPSVICGAYRRLLHARQSNQTRLLLCGSAMSLMSRLFSGPSPLRGLAGLELVIRPLDFRQAARFWGLEDAPRLALLVHAVVGGTPAYRRDYVADDAPTGPDDFDDWVRRTVLNPRMPLFWEARHLLEEEADHWDRALCHSALAAVASGCSTRGEIAECLDHPVLDVTHTLALLEDRGLLHGEADAFRPHLMRYRIAEPLMAFEHAVAWPRRSSVEEEGATGVWQRARSTFESAVVGPHFAQVCRDWVLGFASPETFGGRPTAAARGTLPDAARNTIFDVGVVVRGQAGGRPGVLLSVGQARWDETMDVHHLERLRHILSLLAARGEDVSHARPACYSGAGFTPGLRAAETHGEVVLIDLERLYQGR